MGTLKRKSSKSWITINIVLPFSFFILGGFIRLGTTGGKINWNTFNAADLAICMALLCLLVNQSILRNRIVLINTDKINEMEGNASEVLLYGIGSIVMFALLVAFQSIVYDCTDKAFVGALRTFQIFMFVVTPFPIWRIISMKRNMKLEASIL
jgi:hypothetical protein